MKILSGSKDENLIGILLKLTFDYKIVIVQLTNNGF